MKNICIKFMSFFLLCFCVLVFIGCSKAPILEQELIKQYSHIHKVRVSTPITTVGVNVNTGTTSLGVGSLTTETSKSCTVSVYHVKYADGKQEIVLYHSTGDTSRCRF